MIRYGIVETGKTLWKRADQNVRLEFIYDLKSKAIQIPNDTDLSNSHHLAILFGAKAMGMRIGSLRTAIDDHAEFANHLRNYEVHHGKDAIVRLRIDLVLEARDGGGTTPLELSILAAIYSVIGDKKHPVRITQETIRCRSLGYKNKPLMKAERRYRKNVTQPISDWKLRKTLENLTARKLFVRRTIGRRATYYSHRMSEQELEFALIKARIRRNQANKLQREKNEAITKRIRELRA